MDKTNRRENTPKTHKIQTEINEPKQTKQQQETFSRTNDEL